MAPPTARPPLDGPAFSVPLRLCLVRHGRTSLNAAGVLRGRLDPPLDDVGEAEVRRLAATLATRDIGLVVSSPLRRARQTARAIADAAELEPEVDDELADRDYGQWAGHTVADVVERFGSLDAAPGVERAGEVRCRALEALYRIVRRSPPATVVVVAHDVVNRLLLTTLAPELGEPGSIGQHTACYNEITRVDGNWEVQSVDQRPPGPTDQLPPAAGLADLP